MKPSENSERNSRIGFAVCWVVLAVCVALWICALSGCASTVAPERIESRQASWDGNAQNSGLIMSVPSGYVVTSHWRERHNALIATYGGDFSPVLKPDHGIAPIGEDRWLVSRQAYADFCLMNDWRLAGLKPKN